MKAPTLSLRVRAFGRAGEGETAVEMAFVVLLFLFMIYAIYQFALGMYMWNAVMLAAEEGGRQAMIHNSVYADTSASCDLLWSDYVKPFVNYNLPGDASDYTLSYGCNNSTTPATMSIAVSYSLIGGGSFSSTWSIPGFTLTGQSTVPLD